MHLRQQQKSSNEGESSHLAVPQLEVFGMVGNPLPTSSNAGISLRALMTLLGHVTPQMTIRYATLASPTLRTAYDEAIGKMRPVHPPPCRQADHPGQDQPAEVTAAPMSASTSAGIRWLHGGSDELLPTAA
jgi:hypothetical protein